MLERLRGDVSSPVPEIGQSLSSELSLPILTKLVPPPLHAEFGASRENSRIAATSGNRHERVVQQERSSERRMTTACQVGRLPREHKQQCQRIRPIDFTVAVDIKIRNTPTWQTVRHLP